MLTKNIDKSLTIIFVLYTETKLHVKLLKQKEEFFIFI